jgi:putative Mn2+ efflux pump MntP
MLQTLILAFSLSTDAFAASVAKGARFPKMGFGRIAAIAFSFGLLEASAPLLGYLLGMQFAGAIEAFDHWIAFTILGFLGGRMIWMSFEEDAEDTDTAMPTVAAVFATALGTSVDATAVGVSLALFSDNIPLTLATIGAVTLTMTLIGLRLGGVIGARTGKWAERIGGVGLFAIGAKILVSHLTA